MFNITERLPNVLLVGNGVIRNCASYNGLTSNNWSRHIYSISKRNISDKEQELLEKVPCSIQATVLAPLKDVDRHNEYLKEFISLDFADNSLLNDLVSIGFDSILTTNYTYEIENCFHPGYSSLSSKLPYSKTIKRQSLQTKNDTKYLLHTYNEFKNSPPIWHIHGETRRKSSVVLTHDEYSRLINCLLEENKRNKNKFILYENEVKYKSWLDYLLVSNLYIVGFGMGFSEFDLWWILNRRMREKAHTGKIIFFNSKDDCIAVQHILSQLKLDIEVKSFDIKCSDEKYYFELYSKITEYIKNDIGKTKERNK